MKTALTEPYAQQMLDRLIKVGVLFTSIIEKCVGGASNNSDLQAL